MLELDKIYNMDCIVGMKQLGNKSIDIVITDPPYTTPVVTGFGRQTINNVGDLSIQENFIKIIKNELKRILSNRAVVLIFCDDGYYPSIYRAFYEWNTKNLIIWDKGKIGMGKPIRKQHELIFYTTQTPWGASNRVCYPIKHKHFPSVISFKSVSSNDKLIGSDKPIDLIETLIKCFSNDDYVVLDPFMGSGTTAVACKRLGRHFIGFEINEEYCDIANKRLYNVPIKLDEFQTLN